MGDRLRAQEEESGFELKPPEARFFFRAGMAGAWRSALRPPQLLRPGDPCGPRQRQGKLPRCSNHRAGGKAIKKQIPERARSTVEAFLHQQCADTALTVLSVYPDAGRAAGTPLAPIDSPIDRGEQRMGEIVASMELENAGDRVSSDRGCVTNPRFAARPGVAGQPSAQAEVTRALRGFADA